MSETYKTIKISCSRSRLNWALGVSLILFFGCAITFYCFYTGIIDYFDLLGRRTVAKYWYFLFTCGVGTFFGFIGTLHSGQLIYRSPILELNKMGVCDKRYFSKPFPWKEIDSIQLLEVQYKAAPRELRVRIKSDLIEGYLFWPASFLTKIFLDREKNTVDIICGGFLKGKHSEVRDAFEYYMDLIEITEIK